MTSDTKHISISINRSAAEVYEYTSSPAHLAEWAAGLGAPAHQVDGQWVADLSIGRITINFAPRNSFGILDHEVTLPSGEVVTNPMRVIPNKAGCDVVFTLRREPGMSNADFERDAKTIFADLSTLKKVLEHDK